MAPIHVVLAVNNSEHSQYAFNWAIKNFLRTNDHRVTLLTVVEPPIQAGYYYAASAGTLSSPLRPSRSSSGFRSYRCFPFPIALLGMDRSNVQPVLHR